MKKLLLASAMALSFVTVSPSQSWADLLISPLRIVMEGRDRSTHVTLLNTGNAKNTYRLEWVQLEQAEYLGGYQETLEKTKDDTHLKDFTVFTPRQITLLPDEKQVVRLGVRRPADLPDGEYKSHLKFGIVASEVVNKGPAKELTDDEISVAARVLSSYSIPAVYRVGEYDCTVSIGEITISAHENSGNMVVTVPVIHEGIHGAIGQTEVYHTPNGGDEVLLKAIGNTNLFPEATQRNVKIATDVKGVSPGTFKIVFKKAEGDLSDHVILAEREFAVGN